MDVSRTHLKGHVGVHFENPDVGEGTRDGAHNGQYPNQGSDDHRETRCSPSCTLNSKSRKRLISSITSVFIFARVFLFMAHCGYHRISFYPRANEIRVFHFI